ncbi:BCCT family transporter, partial [Escherichia coli]|nr:BCCT family transporter [Escherichia coli]
PPEGAGQTIEAARQAMVWTLFHYGLTGWSMYALMGMVGGMVAVCRLVPGAYLAWAYHSPVRAGHVDYSVY